MAITWHEWWKRSTHYLTQSRYTHLRGQDHTSRFVKRGKTARHWKLFCLQVIWWKYIRKKCKNNTGWWRVGYWCGNSVCPSVRPSGRSSLTLVLYPNGLTYYRDSPKILVFSVLSIFAKFRRGRPYGGFEYKWCI